MTEQEFSDKMRQLIMDIRGLLEEHERQEHNGDKCNEERANTAAFLIHILNIRVADFKLVLKQLLGYDARHVIQLATKKEGRCPVCEVAEGEEHKADCAVNTL